MQPDVDRYITRKPQPPVEHLVEDFCGFETGAIET
jgi:hypothetical protein